MHTPPEDQFHHSLSPDVPGLAPVHIDPDDLDGIWVMAFGRFGWKEYESRSVILRIDKGKVFGGGSHFVYRGTGMVEGATIKLLLDVDRYRPDPDFKAITGFDSEHFFIDLLADALSRDHFEGRVRSENTPDLRMALRRFAPL